MGYKDLEKLMQKLTKKMHMAAAELNFELAADLRDQILVVKKHMRE